VAATYPFQVNDGGRSGSHRPKEKNDCTVRALAIAFGMTYDLAYDILQAAGRKEHGGFHFRPWLEQRRTFNGYRIEWMEFPAVKGCRRMNPAAFAKTRRFKRGRFICRTAKHVYAVLDGVVQDVRPEYDGRCIYGAYRLTPLKARRTRRTTKRRGARKASRARQARPFVGPCRDMLELWFLEFEQDNQVLRRYYGDGPEARHALKHYKATGQLLPSGTWDTARGI